MVRNGLVNVTVFCRKDQLGGEKWEVGQTVSVRLSVAYQNDESRFPHLPNGIRYD